VRELRQQAREEDEHLRIAEVAEQALAEGTLTRRPAPRRRDDHRLRSHRRPQRLRAEHDQVGASRDPQREERRLRGNEQRADADPGRDRPGRLPRRDPERRQDSGSPAAEKRVADGQRRVLPGRRDHQGRHGEKGGDLRHREAVSHAA